MTNKVTVKVEEDRKVLEKMRFVIPKLLASMPYPRKSKGGKRGMGIEEILHLKRNNIFGIVNLEKNLDKGYDEKQLKSKGIEYLNIPISDGKKGKRPTMANVNIIVSFVEKLHKKGFGAVIHCRSGRGRTGTALCCVLLKNGGFGKSKEVLDFVRKKNDLKSVQFKDDQDFILEYEKSLQPKK